jgi:hypothetical protein
MSTPTLVYLLLAIASLNLILFVTLLLKPSSGSAGSGLSQVPRDELLGGSALVRGERT